jgi:hypothetical protein
MVDATDAGLIGVRDRALILLGFAGAFRRSELFKLDVEDCPCGGPRSIRPGRAGIGIPYGSNRETCPVRNIQDWIDLACINASALFRSLNRHAQIQPRRLSGVDVARIVKKLVHRAGLDAVKYAGHSLRAGHATSAAISAFESYQLALRRLLQSQQTRQRHSQNRNTPWNLGESSHQHDFSTCENPEVFFGSNLGYQV